MLSVLCVEPWSTQLKARLPPQHCSLWLRLLQKHLCLIHQDTGVNVSIGGTAVNMLWDTSVNISVLRHQRFHLCFETWQLKNLFWDTMLISLSETQASASLFWDARVSIYMFWDAGVNIFVLRHWRYFLCFGIQAVTSLIWDTGVNISVLGNKR